MNADDYPLLSIAQNEQGVVLLDFLINEDGSIADVKVAKSSGYARLDGAAVDASRQRWRFDPVRVGGRPVSCRATVGVNWILNWTAEQLAELGFTIVRMTASDYPPGSLARGEQGTSLIMAQIDSTGRVVNATTAQASGFADLDAAAIAAARSGRWPVVPPQVSGKPASAMIGFVVVWSPSGK
ncbi:MAG TPA: TonB family protein [Rhizomicrobium sp.]|jgi:TonB family protein